MTDLEFRGEVVAGLIAIVRAWGRGLTGVDLAREVRCGALMAVRAIEKRYPELALPVVYRQRAYPDLILEHDLPLLPQAARDRGRTSG